MESVSFSIARHTALAKLLPRYFARISFNDNGHHQCVLFKWCLDVKHGIQYDHITTLFKEK